MFVHLHVHSHYSFLDSTLRIEEIVEAACRAKMDAVALTDTNGLYAVVPFLKACRRAGLRPILGAEIDGFDPAEVRRKVESSKLKVESCRFGVPSSKLKVESYRWGAEVGQSASARPVGPDSLHHSSFSVQRSSFILHPSSFIFHPSDHLRVVVLARDRLGYAELSRLVTQRRLMERMNDEGGRMKAESGLGFRVSGSGNTKYEIPSAECGVPNAEFSVDPAFSIQHSSFSVHPSSFILHPSAGTLLDSLLALSEEHVWILTDSPALLGLLAGRRNVFAELVLTARRRGLCRRLYDRAHALRIPLVAAGDVHFERPEDYSLYRLLRAIDAQKTIETLDDEDSIGPNKGDRLATRPAKTVDEEHYFKTADEMARAFRGLRGPLRNTRYIAERCDVDLALGTWKFPRVTLPRDETAFSYLWKVTFDGLKQRYRPLTPEATRRLEYELETIARLGFCEYFLAVNEIVQATRGRGFLVLGRGSAANSIVSFALGLTPVDPIRHNLYFERFLNPERRSPPDIDLDFSWKQRDAVVRWIFDHFGHDRVALISTHITLQARQAIREVGKAMGVAESEVNRFTRPIPGWLGEGKALAQLPEVFPECRDLPIGDEPWKTILAHAQRLLDFPRHLSIHCGGLLITPEPITNYTPLQRAAKGPIITQMEMHAIEDLGLIKIDILGNRSLGVLDDCLHALAAKMSNEQRAMSDEQRTTGNSGDKTAEDTRAVAAGTTVHESA